MNTRISSFVVATAMITLSTAAMAGPKCNGDQPKMDPEAVKKIYLDKGYEIKKFKTSSGGCYEIYAIREGKKSEIYIDPWTAAALSTK